MKKAIIVDIDGTLAKMNGRGPFEWDRVKFVLDDRNQVVDMWRKDLGLTCLQVDYGDF